MRRRLHMMTMMMVVIMTRTTATILMMMMVILTRTTIIIIINDDDGSDLPVDLVFMPHSAGVVRGHTEDATHTRHNNTMLVSICITKHHNNP